MSGKKGPLVGGIIAPVMAAIGIFAVVFLLALGVREVLLCFGDEQRIENAENACGADSGNAVLDSEPQDGKF